MQWWCRRWWLDGWLDNVREQRREERWSNSYWCHREPADTELHQQTSENNRGESRWRDGIEYIIWAFEPTRVWIWRGCLVCQMGTWRVSFTMRGTWRGQPTVPTVTSPGSHHGMPYSQLRNVSKGSPFRPFVRAGLVNILSWENWTDNFLCQRDSSARWWAGVCPQLCLHWHPSGDHALGQGRLKIFPFHHLKTLTFLKCLFRYSVTISRQSTILQTWSWKEIW